jgi:hypothetical protein
MLPLEHAMDMRMLESKKKGVPHRPRVRIRKSQSDDKSRRRSGEKDIGLLAAIYFWRAQTFARVFAFLSLRLLPCRGHEPPPRAFYA